MESPMKKEEDVLLNSLISKELKEFLKPDIITQLNEFKEKILTRVN